MLRQTSARWGDATASATTNRMTPPTPKNRVSPKKLLLSKWTATTPRHKEKHFVVVRLVLPDPAEGPVEQVELEAVHSRRSMVLRWRELTDRSQWLQGWV